MLGGEGNENGKNTTIGLIKHQVPVEGQIY